MLRNILIAIGTLVALNPYLGFPQSIDKFILTGLGLTTVFLLLLSRRERAPHAYDSGEGTDSTPKILHVERTEVEDSPRMHIERTTTLDTEEVEGRDGEQTMTEKKTTVVRRRKRKPDIDSPQPTSEIEQSQRE